jgi:predicted HTH transcriptional regulator
VTLSQIAKRKIKTKDVYLKACIHVSLYHNFPTVRWLVENTELTSTSMVVYHLQKLLHSGLLERNTHVRNGAYMITGSVWLYPEHSIMFGRIQFGHILDEFLSELE